MKKKKLEEGYQLTPKGLFSLLLAKNYTLDQIMDNIELTMRRLGHNAIIFNGTEFIFDTVEKG